MGGEYLFVLPPHGLPGGKGLGYVQQTLVAAAAEVQLQRALGKDERAVHQHVGNTETYHILSGHALYNDNGKEVEIGAGTTTFCPDGETHGIKNTSKTEDLVFMALIIRK